VQQLRQLISAAEQQEQQEPPSGGGTYSPEGGESDGDGDYMPDGSQRGRVAATRREHGQQQQLAGSRLGKSKQQQQMREQDGEMMWVREDLGVCSEEQSEQMLHDADEVRRVDMGGEEKGREGEGGGELLGEVLMCV
jgi:hypothetical protein